MTLEIEIAQHSDPTVPYFTGPEPVTLQERVHRGSSDWQRAIRRGVQVSEQGGRLLLRSQAAHKTYRGLTKGVRLIPHLIV